MKIDAKTKVDGPGVVGVRLDRQDMLIMGREFIASALRRLQRGKGVDDRQMKEYSKDWKAYRIEHGRPVDRRDLHFTGRLYGSLHVADYDARHYEVGFADRINRAKAKENHERTPWWGVSPSDRKKIKASLTRRMSRRYRRG